MRKCNVHGFYNGSEILGCPKCCSTVQLHEEVILGRMLDPRIPELESKLARASDLLKKKDEAISKALINYIGPDSTWQVIQDSLSLRLEDNQ